MSAPNQKIVIINRRKVDRNFLQIGILDWQLAYKALKPAAFGIYLYLASNADGYKLELSQAAIENALGIKKTTYYEALKQLESAGYLELLKNNTYNFYSWVDS